MLKQIGFRVNHRPQPQPRPKAARMGGMVRIYTPQLAAVTRYKEAVKEAFLMALLEHGVSLQDWEPWNQPLAVSLRFVMKRPDNQCGDKFRQEEHRHTKKPDLDNLAKGTLDALSGYAWTDDSFVTDLMLSKFTSGVSLGGVSGKKRIPEAPYVSILITPIVLPVDKVLE